MRDWRAAAEGKAEAPALRRTFVLRLRTRSASRRSAVRAAPSFVSDPTPGERPSPLAGLDTLNWLRSNADLWEGRALIGGRMLKSAASVALTSNALKLHLGLELGPEEMRLEDAHRRERPGHDKIA
jgi:DNA sulfur modification protein DndB